ncbi:MAG: hypothetical protein LBH10_00585 [Burkholderiaceae bacterium]|nr:hypothetical protein [Burkholderiaceae bacterium]
MRPGTLPLSGVAIAQGSARAAWRGAFDLMTAALALLTAILLQILCNLANDYGDVRRGCDGFARIGPRRARLPRRRAHAGTPVPGGFCRAGAWASMRIAHPAFSRKKR